MGGLTQVTNKTNEAPDQWFGGWLRIGFGFAGLLLVFISLMGWGKETFVWGLSDITPHAIQQYDLRPFVFSSRTLQIWFPAVVGWGWAVVAAAGVGLATKGIRGGRRGRFVFVWTAGAFLVAAVLWCVSGPAFRVPGAVPVMTLQGAQRMTHVRFPPGTQLVEARYEGGMDPRFLAKVTMPPKAVKSFVLATPPAVVHLGFEKPLPIEWSRTENPELRVSGLEGLSNWHPERAKRFLSASVTTPEGQPTVEVLADLDDPGTAVVYLTIDY